MLTKQRFADISICISSRHHFLANIQHIQKTKKNVLPQSCPRPALLPTNSESIRLNTINPSSNHLIRFLQEGWSNPVDHSGYWKSTLCPVFITHLLAEATIGRLQFPAFIQVANGRKSFPLTTFTGSGFGVSGPIFWLLVYAYGVFRYKLLLKRFVNH